MNFAINELTQQELELMLNKKREYLHVLELECLLSALEASLEIIKEIMNNETNKRI